MIGSIGAWFNILVCFGIPLATLVYLVVKKRSYLKYFLFGILGFTISQVIIRIPILTYIQSTLGYAEFSLYFPLLTIFLVALSAGLVEEPARYLFLFPSRKKEFDIKIPVVYGIAHAGIEAILFVGMNNLILVVTQQAFLSVQGWEVFLAGFERISAFIAHISFSIIVYVGLIRKKKRYLLYAIALHTLFNFSIVLTMAGLSAALLELVLFIEALIILFIAQRSVRKVSKQ